jgi:hypothetical protein
LSQIGKLFEKLKRKPTPSDILFDKIDRLLKAYDFIQRQPSGGSSHYIYTHPKLSNYRLSIAKHGNKVKAGYVRETVNAIEKVRELYGGDKNEKEIK